MEWNISFIYEMHFNIDICYFDHVLWRDVNYCKNLSVIAVWNACEAYFNDVFFS